MKVFAVILMVILTGGLIGGTIWLMLSLSVAAWLETSIGVVGFVLATGVNLGLYWFLWPRPTIDDEDD